MTKATAKVNGVTIAETDTWETVEGNIYVSFCHLLFYACLRPASTQVLRVT
jgi:hypothetical protein